MEKEYWNDTYWKQHLDKHKDKELDFLSDIWIDKYSNIINNIPKGKVLDLGAGLGQYSKYFNNKGFDVVSTDISIEALNKLKESMPNAEIMQLDMKEKLPFEDNYFNIIVANLSIHYFDKDTTIALLEEIRRVTKNGGYFIGSVNSSKSFKYIKDVAEEIEENYYYENGRNVRLWDKQQFDDFFTNYALEVLEEVTTLRWNREKVMWEFIAKVKK